MTTTNDDGGPAFPSQLVAHSGGMSLLDWFAGQVLAGSCSNPGLVPMSEKELAEACYAQAAAMVLARKGATR